MEVTVSGVPRARRGTLRAIIEALHGVYSGELSVGRTAAVVVEGAVDWAAPKLAAAAASGIPVVSYEWLLDSQANGYLLHFGPYTLPAQEGRRSSAASSSALQRGGELSAAHGAAAPAAPTWQLAAGEEGAATHAPTPASAERIRAAVHPLPADAPGMLHHDSSPARSPAGMSHSGSNRQCQQALAPHFAALALHAQLPSPVSPAHMQQATTEAACILLPLDERSPQLPLLPDVLEAAGAGEQAQPFFEQAVSHGPLQPGVQPAVDERGSTSPSSPQRPAVEQVGGQHPPGAEVPDAAHCRAAGSQAVAATPAVVSAATDSDGKVARILGRMPNVTLARGSCLPRWRRPPSLDSCESSQGDSSFGSGDSSFGSSPLGSLRGRGSAEHPGSSQRGSYRVEAMCGHTEGPVDGTEEPAEEGAGLSSAGASGTCCVLQPAEGGEDAQQEEQQVDNCVQEQHEREQQAQGRDQEGKEVKKEDHGRLPASTLIRLGSQLSHPPPANSIFVELAARHGATCSTAEQRRGVTFHNSATALPLGGAELLFVAGDATHAARMLYDIVGGCQIHALVLVQAIYRLGDTVWMQHRYLLTADDVRERPEWALALQGHPALEPAEVLLSSCTYHSPMHLIVGQAWLTFSASSLASLRRRHRRAAGQLQEADSKEDGQYICRRGFDAATCTLVPLRRALEGLTLAA